MFTRSIDHYLSWDPAQGVVARVEHVVETDGTSLLAALSLPCVDYRRTISNDVQEVLAVRVFLFVVLAAVPLAPAPELPLTVRKNWSLNWG